MDYDRETRNLSIAILNVYSNWNILKDPAQSLRQNIQTILVDICEKEQLRVDIARSALLLAEPCAAIYNHLIILERPEECLMDCIRQCLRIMVEIDAGATAPP